MTTSSRSIASSGDTVAPPGVPNATGAASIWASCSSTVASVTDTGTPNRPWSSLCAHRRGAGDDRDNGTRHRITVRGILVSGTHGDDVLLTRNGFAHLREAPAIPAGTIRVHLRNRETSDWAMMFLSEIVATDPRRGIADDDIVLGVVALEPVQHQLAIAQPPTRRSGRRGGARRARSTTPRNERRTPR